MSDKPKPVDDLKEGLGLLFRAAKGAVEAIPTEKLDGVTGKIESVAKDAAKEVGRAFESLGSEVEKIVHPNKPNTQPPQGAAPPATNAAPPAPEPPKEEVKYDDGYAPEPPPKGPRVG